MSLVTALPPDLYEAVTMRIISVLEKGTAPWVRPWSQDLDSMPMNAGSRRPYRGINALLLSLEATHQGYPLNRWLTYRQAIELGGQVRRGEKGTTVVLWRLRNIAATSDTYPTEHEPDLEERIIPLLRAFTVFNLAQVDGVPATLQTVVRHDWEPLARAEELIRSSQRPRSITGAPRPSTALPMTRFSYRPGRCSRPASATTQPRFTS